MKAPPLNIRFVIPAHPGYYTLTRYEDAADFSKTPILGWAVDDYNCTVAVTSEGVDENYHAILNPDGTVENSIGAWDSVEAWAADPLCGGGRLAC